MGGVGGQVAQVEGLVHNALPSKSGVSVQEDGHHLVRHKATAVSRGSVRMAGRGSHQERARVSSP